MIQYSSIAGCTGAQPVGRAAARAAVAAQVIHGPQAYFLAFTILLLVAGKLSTA